MESVMISPYGIIFIKQAGTEKKKKSSKYRVNSYLTRITLGTEHRTKPVDRFVLFFLVLHANKANTYNMGTRRIGIGQL